MSESQRAGDAPIGVDVVEGKSYYSVSYTHLTLPTKA